MKTVQMKSIFQIGPHVLQVFGNQGRWVVAVDGVLLRGWHSTSADAWSAGVAEVDRLGHDVSGRGAGSGQGGWPEMRRP